ncbi:MAG: NYN domain-containing protein [Cyanobacteria bacterium J06649_4]
MKNLNGSADSLNSMATPSEKAVDNASTPSVRVSTESPISFSESSVGSKPVVEEPPTAVPSSRSRSKATSKKPKPRTRSSAKSKAQPSLQVSSQNDFSAVSSSADATEVASDSNSDDFARGFLKPTAKETFGTDGAKSEKNSEKNLVNRSFSLSAKYPSVNQSSDRIAIFIDGSNLFYAASHLNIEVDYRRLLSSLVRGRRLLRAYFYTGVDPQNEKQRGFLLWLNRHGHRVVSKELTHLPDGSRKANMHVEMAVDMMRIAEYCPTLTLLGGDGNLAYALKVLSQRGTLIEVVSLQSMTSDSLIDIADSYTDLADLRDDIKR